MISPVTSIAGTVIVQVYDANSGGSAGLGLTALKYQSLLGSNSFSKFHYLNNDPPHRCLSWNG